MCDQALHQAKSVIDELYAKYSDDEYMFQKTHNYICFQLSNVLENMKKNHEINQARIQDLTNEQDLFIQNFFNTHSYFYVSTTEKYFYYDGLNYKVCNEDDILHHVLTTISKDRMLMPWKKSTKVFVMKKIREQNLLKSVPESETIQSVLDMLYPSLFGTRTEAKYFLTLLGDNMFKKHSDLVHFVTPKSKHFIRELTNISQLLLGANVSSSIKYKYYGHEYQNSRLLKINDAVLSENVWGTILQRSVLDLLCVACHYSIRYNSSDEFILNNANEPDLENRVFYLKQCTETQIVNNFVCLFLQSRDTRQNCEISWKDIQYLWKLFLDSKQIPNVMFQQTLKQEVVAVLNNYNDERDVFSGYTSKYLPAIHHFLCFWDETVIMEHNELEYEIEELCMLYKHWCEKKGKMTNQVAVSDTMMLDLITYYYSGVEVENGKNVFNIKCSLWDKQLDVQTALDQLKHHVQNTDMSGCRSGMVMSGSRDSLFTPSSPQHQYGNGTAVSIYDAYVWYCKYYSDITSNSKRPLVSKYYFEKYVLETMGEFVLDSKFISLDWVLDRGICF